MTAKEKFILFSELADIPRTGWVQRGIENPESVAAHIYGCWLLGVFLLPEAYPADGYDKQRILNMLLLHDLPEAVTGDIPRPQKKQDPAYYDRLEAEAAQNSLLSGACAPAQRALWLEWCEQKTCNALAAKDIDDLQAIFTMTRLRMRQPECITDTDAAQWLDGLTKLRTDVGRMLAKALFEEP